MADIVSVVELGLPTPSDSNPCFRGGGCCFSTPARERGKPRLGINILVIAMILENTLVTTGEDIVGKKQHHCIILLCRHAQDIVQHQDLIGSLYLN